jgi:hypothetical protein
MKIHINMYIFLKLRLVIYFYSWHAGPEFRLFKFRHLNFLFL